MRISRLILGTISSNIGNRTTPILGLILLAPLIMIMAIHSIEQVTDRHKSLIGSTKTITFEVTIGHLLFEEKLGSNVKGEISEALIYLDQAQLHASAVHDEIRNNRIIYFPNRNAELRLETEILLRKISRFRNQAGKLAEQIDPITPEMINHSQIESTFKEILMQAHQIENTLHYAASVEQKWHHLLMSVLVVICLGLSIVACTLILRYESKCVRTEKAILCAIENERCRIGADIHDGLVQQLAGVLMLSESLDDRSIDRNFNNSSTISRIRELLALSVNQARGLARGLCPVNIEQDGLVTALKAIAETTQSLYGIPCSFRLHNKYRQGCESLAVEKTHYDTSFEEIPSLGTETNIQIYRIIQEAVNNAIKHGSPQAISIEMITMTPGNKGEYEVSFSIEDDGIGISKNRNLRKGLGLYTMKRRAGMIGASLDIGSLPAGGTIVSCSLKTKTHENSVHLAACI